MRAPDLASSERISLRSSGGEGDSHTKMCKEQGRVLGRCSSKDRAPKQRKAGDI